MSGATARRRLDLSTMGVGTAAGAGAPPPPIVAANGRAVRIAEVAPNPFNSRDLNSAPAQRIAALAESIKERGQLQPASVVQRDAFLRIFPEHRATIGDAEYVQISGGRRRLALLQLEATRIEITVNHKAATSRLGFLAATLDENNEREDLNPIEEAHALRLMLDETDSNQSVVALTMNRSQGWVSQRIGLLKLLPELQMLVRSGEMPVRIAREVSALPPEQQRDRWLSLKPAADQEAGDGPGEGDAAPARAGDRPRRSSPKATAVRRLGDTAPQIGETLLECLGRDRAVELGRWLVKTAGE